MAKALGKERLRRFRRAEGLIERSHIPPQSRRAVYKYDICRRGLVDQRQETLGEHYRASHRRCDRPCYIGVFRLREIVLEPESSIVNKHIDMVGNTVELATKCVQASRLVQIRSEAMNRR